MSTPKHCPGWENFREMKSFICGCPECGEEVEIFSDEFDKPRSCGKCGKPIDFTKCTLEGSASTGSPR